jgi:isopenicillin N synthase-like dioxygenase
MTDVPVIDISGERLGDEEASLVSAEAIDEALCGSGFFVISGHGIETDLMEQVSSAARGFFDLPAEQKEGLRSKAQGSARGYVSMGASALARTMGRETPGDFRESYGLGPIQVIEDADGRFYAPNIWPSFYAPLQPALEAWYEAMQGLNRVLLRQFARALLLAPEYFESRFEGHNSTLRAFNYPAHEHPPLPGQMRVGEHTDYGAYTVLLGGDVTGGLQVCTRAGDWIDVHAPAGTFVINVGDLMMRWTNDRWLSNQHRLANPPSEHATARRQSIAFFANPREDVLISALPTCIALDWPTLHGPILAGEHRLEKFLAAERVSRPVPAPAVVVETMP